jgi:hypothetical protein
MFIRLLFRNQWKLNFFKKKAFYDHKITNMRCAHRFSGQSPKYKFRTNACRNTEVNPQACVYSSLVFSVLPPVSIAFTETLRDHSSNTKRKQRRPKRATYSHNFTNNSCQYCILHVRPILSGRIDWNMHRLAFALNSFFTIALPALSCTCNLRLLNKLADFMKHPWCDNMPVDSSYLRTKMLRPLP